MKRSKLAGALSLIMAAGIMAPALADDEGLTKAVDGSLFVTRLGGLGAGWVLGTPVSVVRHTAKSYVAMTNSAADKVGGHDFGPSVALVSLATFPAAVIIGGAKGIYGGTQNALVHGFNEPFHPDSFSLGNLEE